MRPIILTSLIAGVCMSFNASAADLSELSAAEAAKQIRDGKITSEQLVRAVLDKAKAGAKLNAFITLDEDGALRAARWADQQRKAGRELGPLHGVPVAIKDNIHVRGMPNTAGAPALRNFVPAHNAPIAQRLVDAGAIVIGKASMHELAFGITNANGGFGAVGNPYDPTRFPGGSSGGTGAAIAARMSPAGLGSDTGGSVRIPAALCGIAGLRPTLGRYSQEAITPISHTRDTAGPMARTVQDVALLDGVITGEKADLAAMDLKGLRLGVPRAYFYAPLDSETARVTEEALAKLKAAGAELVEVDIAGIGELNGKISFPVALYEVMQDLPAYLRKYNTGIDMQTLTSQLGSPDVKGLFGLLMARQPPTIPKEVYDQAIAARPALKKMFADYFKDNNLVAMVFPATPTPAKLIATETQEFDFNGQKAPTFPTFIRNSDPGSNAGVPGLVLPIGMSKDGLPIGLEIGGPEGSDRTLLAIGLAVEPLMPKIPAPK